MCIHDSLTHRHSRACSHGSLESQIAQAVLELAE